MHTLAAFLIGVAVGIFLCMVYASLVSAGRADEQLDKFSTTIHK